MLLLYRRLPSWHPALGIVTAIPVALAASVGTPLARPPAGHWRCNDDDVATAITEAVRLPTSI